MARLVLYLLWPLLVLGVAGVAVLNAWVDPLQRLRAAPDATARYWPTLQRAIVPGMARHHDFDTAILGSSMMENMSVESLEKAFGGRAINLSISNAKGHELGRLLALLLDRSQPPRRVWIGMDDIGWTVPVRETGDGLPLSEPLWSLNPLQVPGYLLNLDTLQRSLDVLQDRPGSPAWNRDGRNPWLWTDTMRWGRAAVGRDGQLSVSNLNAFHKAPPMHFERMRANLEANLLPWLRQARQTQVLLVFPPVSALVWVDYHQRGELDEVLRMRRWLIEATRDLSHVEIHEFQTDRRIVLDLSHYKDLYHYRRDIAEQLPARVASGTSRVTAQQADAWIDGIRQLATGTDPARLLGR